VTKRQGILLIDKPTASTSFRLVALTRHLLGVQKVGHAGTLDPLATGVLVLLVGRDYTRMSHTLINDDKEYIATVCFGIGTDSYDSDGQVIEQSENIPTQETIEAQLQHFQGWQDQVPPMFSAKKVGGQKLYDLARRGIEIERQPVNVFMAITLLSYEAPYLRLHVRCSKGTYIRSLARDLGVALRCPAHLSALRRSRSGQFSVEECVDGALLCAKTISAEELSARLIQLPAV
jgi:tRNA pseudouridine55 synthase